MKRDEIICRLRSLNLSPSEYWVVTGAALVLHGVREATHDIDMGCSSACIDHLIRQGHPCENVGDGRRVAFDDLEFYEDWTVNEIECIEGIPVASLSSILYMKEQLNREKDRRDIELIRAFMKNHPR